MEYGAATIEYSLAASYGNFGNYMTKHFHF